jgi:hypothetical protein
VELLESEFMFMIAWLKSNISKHIDVLKAHSYNLKIEENLDESETKNSATYAFTLTYLD